MGEAARQAKDEDGPLAGIRVLEIGHFVAAPFCTRLLADLGADVIKLEPPGGDPVRQWGAHQEGRSLWWSVHGRNKRSITVNLKSEKGRDLALRLAARCDVVVENFRPGQLARMGLGDEVMRRERPDLIVAHISGYGQDGPYRDRAAFGVIGEAIGGLRHLTNHPPGTADLPPVRVGISIGDSIAGLYCAFGIAAALVRRGHGGAPATLDVALTESVLSMMEGMLPEYGALGLVKQPTGGGIATAAPTNAYPTSDGAWILIAANSDALFARLVETTQLDALADPGFADNRGRVAHSARLDALIAGWTRGLPFVDIERRLNRADIPNSKVFTAADIADDPQYRARGMVSAVADAELGEVLHPGIVPRLVEAPGRIRWPGPAVGAHNGEVLGGLLGLSAQEIDSLAAEGVI
jgi:crotonobetainyl-CoA:carnitine CoA-transferase CaiB-like acyl-CoA transferase